MILTTCFYSLGYALEDKIHGFHTFTVLASGRYDVYPGGVDAGVTENVSELGDVFFDAVERAGEQVAQVVREDFGCRDIGFHAQGLHLLPYVASVQGSAAATYEYGAGFQGFAFDIAFEFFPEFGDDEDGSRPTFAVYGGFAFSDGFDGYKFQFADADACAGDGLEKHAHAVVAVFGGGGYQADVFGFRQFFFFGAISAALDFELFYAAVVPAGEFEEAICGGEH